MVRIKVLLVHNGAMKRSSPEQRTATLAKKKALSPKSVNYKKKTQCFDKNPKLTGLRPAKQCKTTTHVHFACAVHYNSLSKVVQHLITPSSTPTHSG